MNYIDLLYNYMNYIYRLLDILLYNTEIYLDKYTAWKVILDEPLYIYYTNVMYGL